MEGGMSQAFSNRNRYFVAICFQNIVGDPGALALCKGKEGWVALAMQSSGHYGPSAKYYEVALLLPAEMTARYACVLLGSLITKLYDKEVKLKNNRHGNEIQEAHRNTSRSCG